jgi:hypothetical protein
MHAVAYPQVSLYTFDTVEPSTIVSVHESHVRLMATRDTDVDRSHGRLTCPAGLEAARLAAAGLSGRRVSAAGLAEGQAAVLPAIQRRPAQVGCSVHLQWRAAQAAHHISVFGRQPDLRLHALWVES